MRNVPIRRREQEIAVEEDRKEDEENNGRMTYMQLHHNQTRSQFESPLRKSTVKPNWESIQNSVQNMLSKDIAKRKNLEHA